MQKFNNYLKEMAATVSSLDLEFIKRAEVVSSFNLTGSDFATTKYKAEIQFLIKKHFFPNFDLGLTSKTFNEASVNRAIQALKAENKARFKQLLSWTPKGVGPGEVMLYFVVDDAQLGGGSSAGVDIVSGGKQFEVKAANLAKDGYFKDFRIGGTENISKEIKAASEIKMKLKLSGRETEINKSQIDQIKSSELAKEWLDKVEMPFKKIAYKYFKGHDTIFIINKNPASIVGEVFQKTIGLNDVELDAITGGTIKPKIRK